MYELHKPQHIHTPATNTPLPASLVELEYVDPLLCLAIFLFIAAGAPAVSKTPAASFCFASLLSDRFGWEGGAGVVRGPPV